AARKAAKDAGEESIAFSAREIRESQQLVEDIKASGIKLTDDGEFVLDANIALGGRDPEARAAAKFVSSEEGYRNFVRQFGDSLVSAYEGVIKRLGSLAGRTSDDLGKGFVLTAKDIRSAEGKLIGSFRRSAQAHFKEAPQTARHTFDEMSKSQQNLMGSDGKMLKDKDAVNALIDRYSLKPS